MEAWEEREMVPGIREALVEEVAVVEQVLGLQGEQVCQL